MGRESGDSGLNAVSTGFEHRNHPPVFSPLYGSVAERYDDGGVVPYSDALVRFGKGDSKQLRAVYKRLNEGMFGIDDASTVNTSDFGV